MARLVLVEFDSNSQADAFIQRIDKANGHFRIVGLFAKPTKWCICPRPTGYAKNEVVMGGSYGWWVHRLCRRPRKGTHQPHNLIEPRLSDSDYTTVISSVSLFEVPTRNLKAARKARENASA